MLLFSTIWAHAQQIEGNWYTIDDATGKRKAEVEIKAYGDVYKGQIIQLFTEPGEDKNPKCTECDQDNKRYNRPITGMYIIEGMRYNKDENVLEGGSILDPENGEVYDCKIWLGEDGKLKVRGYVLFMYRTQEWRRAK